jgi:hypothetical protein
LSPRIISSLQGPLKLGFDFEINKNTTFACLAGIKKKPIVGHLVKNAFAIWMLDTLHWTLESL